MGSVYAIGLVGEPVRYVGLTTGTLKRRLKDHRHVARKGLRTPLACWLRKHADDQVEIRLLEKHESFDDLQTAEIRLIKELGTHVSVGGLNVTEGGGGMSGVPEEVREKIRQRIRAIQRAQPELLANLKPYRAGEPPWNKGKTGVQAHSIETRAKMSDSHRQYRQTEEGRESSRRTTAFARHSRWHTNRGIVSPNCVNCREGVISLG